MLFYSQTIFNKTIYWFLLLCFCIYLFSNSASSTTFLVIMAALGESIFPVILGNVWLNLITKNYLKLCNLILCIFSFVIFLLVSQLFHTYGPVSLLTFNLGNAIFCLIVFFCLLFLGKSSPKTSGKRHLVGSFV